ncbi:MAG: hypothetical protein JWR61_1151 [Ferruginibacter sp.]|nr:hypothetical protein [Ferruginibacter sp.]
MIIKRYLEFQCDIWLISIIEKAKKEDCRFTIRTVELLMVRILWHCWVGGCFALFCTLCNNELLKAPGSKYSAAKSARRIYLCLYPLPRCICQRLPQVQSE